MNLSSYPAGLRKFAWHDAARRRPVMADVWYPARPGTIERKLSYGLGDGSVAEAAPIAEAAFPLIVMSHGAGGSARNYAWLAEALARRGFVVLGISHYGESPIYGPETIDPKVFSQLWLRPADVSFGLRQIQAQREFAGRLDLERIAAIGHSSGGATVVSLAGGIFDPSALARYCRSSQASDDRGCDYARGMTGFLPSPREATVSYRDPLVKAIVALDPAAGPGFGEATLAGIAIPALVVGAKQYDFFPFQHHAGRYAAMIPHAKTIVLDHGEGHFVYLNACTSPAEANGVPLCRDRPGVDREAVHANLIAAVDGFLRDALQLR